MQLGESDEHGTVRPAVRRFQDQPSCGRHGDRRPSARAIDTAGLGVATGPGGEIVADSASLATSVPGVFAGGDAVLGPATLVDAMAQGHQGGRRHRRVSARPAKLPGLRHDREGRGRRHADDPARSRSPRPRSPMLQGPSSSRSHARDFPRSTQASRRGAGHRRGQALPGLRSVQRVHAVRQGLRRRRHRARHAARAKT